MFHPESNPLAPKSSGPKKPEKELVRIWLGKEAAAEMDEREPEIGDEDLNFDLSLTEKEEETPWEMKRPDEVTLRNIPTWRELPDEETFKKEFKFQDIWEDEYHKGRPLSAFTPRPKETLPSFQTKEALPYAKVFDINDAIAKAKEKDPEHRGYFSTSEVLEVIDVAGYRPASFEELMAYARDYWKPDVDPKTLTKKERDLQKSQARWIIGLNSVFLSSDGDRCAPRLNWLDDKRKLYAAGIEGAWAGWGTDDHFLVLRKAFTS